MYQCNIPEEEEVTETTMEAVEPEQPSLPAPPAEESVPTQPKPATPATQQAALLKIGASGIKLENLNDLIAFSRMVVVGCAAPGWAFAGVKQGFTYEQSVKIASGAVAVAIQAGLENGLGVLGGLQAFIVIEGNLTWKAEAAAAKIRNSPACRPGSLRFWTEGEGQQIKGVAVAHRIGYHEPDRAEFAWHDANAAGLLTKKNWRTYPKRMFQWRALSWLAKNVFSDVLGGFPLAEEVEDYDVRTAVRTDRAAPPLVGALPPAAAVHPLMQDLGVEPKKAPEPVFVAPAIVDVEATLKMTHAEADAAIAAAEDQGSLFAGRKKK
jgi:hypothetical protein